MTDAPVRRVMRWRALALLVIAAALAGMAPPPPAAAAAPACLIAAQTALQAQGAIYSQGGAHPRDPVDPATGAGSPPRAWGQYASAADSARGRRFTPTGVGTMPLTRSSVAPSTVHPHGRGDNGGTHPPPPRPNGSPPRAWGQ